jgi:alkylated DNA repair protein alkB family protein 8
VQNGCVDGAISIAVLHHISSIPRRVQFLGEMARILKPGGLGLVTVWASQQEDHKKLAKWELISPSNPGLYFLIVAFAIVLFSEMSLVS